MNIPWKTVQKVQKKKKDVPLMVPIQQEGIFISESVLCKSLQICLQ